MEGLYFLFFVLLISSAVCLQQFWGSDFSLFSTYDLWMFNYVMNHSLNVFSPLSTLHVSLTTINYQVTRQRAIYSSTVLKYNFEVLVLYLSISMWCYFILPLHYISEENIVLSTPLHLFDSFSYFSDEDLTQWII